MAGTFFISIKGNKQGQFKAETGKNSTDIPIFGFSYGVTSPRDPATGQATGKRQHKPITIFKEWGVCSVQMFAALVTNEVLTPVTIREMRVDPSGKELTYMEIRLTNAAISTIQVDPQKLDDAPVWTDHEIEQISFTFQKIEIENFLSKSTASDDWEARV
jgi:type VI secretion system secreted protein Hcp